MKKYRLVKLYKIIRFFEDDDDIGFDEYYIGFTTHPEKLESLFEYDSEPVQMLYKPKWQVRMFVLPTDEQSAHMENIGSPFNSSDEAWAFARSQNEKGKICNVFPVKK